MMNKSRQQFEEWRSKNKSSTINLFDVWQASRESLINNLEPVVYASEKDISDLKIFTYLFTEKQSSDSVNIPLYRLD
ncbi:hypothetical protein [Proteus terrae]|uniref:hypothetical protein n=1 Tax=Proteus terrae TaxID=1574161 RepID=UPI001F42CFD3|nr:hypothetical protein [Proteus terrae]